MKALDAAGGISPGPVTNLCGRRWAIFNYAPVVEYWEVHEVEFYWDEYCSVQLTMDKAVSWTKMTTAWALRNNADAAVDQDLATMYSANCRYLVGGCLQNQAFVGIDIGGWPRLAIHHTDKFAKVRCVKLWQSPNATRQTRTIQIGMSLNESATANSAYLNNWHMFGDSIYSDLGGGIWQSRPARNEQLWRLWNGDATAGPWEVAELRFYTDEFCTTEAQGGPIASSSRLVDSCVYLGGCDQYLPKEAFSGTLRKAYALPDALPSRWQAGCNFYDGCKAEEAWIGLDFDVNPVAVNCIRVFQPTYEGFELGYGTPTFTASMKLEAWDGFEWVHKMSIMDFSHGGWNSTQPGPYEAWRLANYDRTNGPWHVAEVQFYEQENCGVVSLLAPNTMLPLAGVPVDSNPTLAVAIRETACKKLISGCSELAFDRLLGTKWESDCEVCLQREAWVGIRTRNAYPDVRCFRLSQGGEREHQTAAVELSAWDGVRWVIKRLETSVGGGSWNYRPAQPLSQWRLVATQETAKPWSLVGIGFFSDHRCTQEIGPKSASPIASGNTYSHALSDAFDDNNYTNWVATCTPARLGAAGCAPSSAWIGVQAFRGELDVNCMRLQQDRDRLKQTSLAALQYWDGTRWLQSKYGTLPDLGGGHWQTLPGFSGAMWRLAAMRQDGFKGVGVSELHFFRDGSCTPNDEVHQSLPNILPISSGFATGKEVQEQTGYNVHMTFIGDQGMCDGFKAFDGDLNTFWADQQSGLAWVGIDLTTQVADMRCVRVALAGLRLLQPLSAELQGWDGVKWATRYGTTGSSWQTTMLWSLPDVSLIGWQRRPTPPRAMWRIENVDRASAWAIREIEFYETASCSGTPVTGNPISSVVTSPREVADGGHALPGYAYDKKPLTMWTAECPPVWYEYGKMMGGCGPGSAWIGLDALQSVVVLCVRMMQAGTRDRMQQSMKLSTWANEFDEGSTFTGWVVQNSFTDLGGDSWNRRPAAPDTLWRVAYMEEHPKACAGEARPAYKRSWGVAELKMFSDDYCKVELPGPHDGSVIITSGTRLPPGNTVTQNLENVNQFAPMRAFDGNANTYWAAECGATATSNRSKTRCVPGEEWIGLDFAAVAEGMPVEVKCVKMHQSRNFGAECCEPAIKVRLERWNGTRFVEAVWRHLARDKAPLKIEAGWDKLGECPAFSQIRMAAGVGALSGWEERGRRQSTTCAIPLSGAVRLLMNPLCEKHPRCLAAGFVGKCCPMEPADSAISRCCCDLLSREESQVFEDEFDLNKDREAIDEAPLVGLEFLIIRCTAVMPFVGIVCGLGFYALALFPLRRKRESYFRFYATFCSPIQRWMINSTDPLAQVIAFFCLRSKKEKFVKVWARRLFGLTLASYLFGCALWISFAVIVAEVVLRLILFLSYVIRWTKSPYEPTSKPDKKRMAFVLGIPLDTGTGKRLSMTGGDVMLRLFQSLVMGIIYTVRALVDLTLMRFAAMNAGAVSLSLTVPTILDRFPPMPIEMGTYVRWVYDFMYYSTWVFAEIFYAMFAGVPRCEGPVLIFTGMCLITISMILIRWINNDYFGIFAVAKHVVTKTRPTFQKTCMIGIIVGSKAAMFTVMQCIMLLFARAVTLVNLNPFQATVQWNCPYEDEEITVMIGRGFLFLTAFLAIIVTVLCADGRFLGQHHLTKDFSERINMSLGSVRAAEFTHLSKEAAENAIIRLSAGMSFIPTTFGFWFDSWNVKGYLIKERSSIYATEMRYPEVCPQCGLAHVPYWELMRATSMQLSLAYQLLPFGAIIGKGCEYLNNPPVWYRGQALKCYNELEHMRIAREGMPKKMGFGKEAMKFRVALVAAWGQDCAVSGLNCLVSMSTYAVLLLFTFFIDMENIDTWSARLFHLLVGLSIVKGALEFVLPGFFLFVFLAMLVMTGRRKSTAMTYERRRRVALAGHILHGTLFGLAVAIFLRNNGNYDLGGWKIRLPKADAVTIGAVIGIFEGWLVVLISLSLEKASGSQILGNLLLAAYNLFIACVGGFMLASDEGIAVKIVFVVVGNLIAIPISGICFLQPKKAAVDPSVLSPLLHFPRALPPPLATIAGVFAGGYASDAIVHGLGLYSGLSICGGIAALAALIMGFGTDGVVGKRSGQQSVMVAACLALPLGIFLHWTIGLFVGSVVGTCTGMWIERKEQKAMELETFEQPLLKTAKVAHKGILDPAQGDLTGGIMQNVTIRGIPAITAWEGHAGHQGGGVIDNAWKGWGETDPVIIPPQKGDRPLDNYGGDGGGYAGDDNGAYCGGSALAISPSKTEARAQPPEAAVVLAASLALALPDGRAPPMSPASPTSPMSPMSLGAPPGGPPRGASRSAVASAPPKKYTLGQAASSTRKRQPTPGSPGEGGLPPSESAYNGVPFDGEVSGAGTAARHNRTQTGATPSAATRWKAVQRPGEGARGW